MIVTCRNCPRSGHLGNTIRYVKLTNDTGKRISIPLCNRCQQQVQIIKRPGIDVGCEPNG